MNKFIFLLIIILIYYFKNKENFTGVNLCIKKEQLKQKKSIELYNLIANQYDAQSRNPIINYFKNTLLNNFINNLCKNNQLSQTDFERWLEEYIEKNKTGIENNISKLPGVMKKIKVNSNNINFNIFHSTSCRISKALLKKESQIKQILSSKNIKFNKFDQNHEITKEMKTTVPFRGYPLTIISDDNENIIDSFYSDRSIDFIRRKINALY